MGRLGGKLTSNLLAGATDDGSRVLDADEQQLVKNKLLAEHRMAYCDRQIEIVRAVLNGLANPVDLQLALNSGCRSQADAEEWSRRNYGPSSVEIYSN